MYSAWSGTVLTNMQQAYQQFYAVLFTVPDIFLSYWQLSTLFWPAWEMQIQCLLHGRGHAGSLARERGHIGSLFTSSTGCIDMKRVKTFCRYSVQAVYFCLCGQSFKWNHLLKYKSIKIYNKLSRVNYLKKKIHFHNTFSVWTWFGLQWTQLLRSVIGKGGPKTCLHAARSLRYSKCINICYRTILLYANVPVTLATLDLWCMKMDSPVKVRSSK